MPKLISSYIPAQVNKYLGKHMLDATLTRSTPGERDPFAVSGGKQATTRDYAASGFVKSYDGTEFAGTVVQHGDAIVVLLGASIEDGIVPVANDTVTIEHPPESGTLVTFRVEAVRPDPVAATYKLLARV